MGSDKSIVILTGAGISADSGLDTFRDKGGIWSQVDLNDVATPEGFAADPVRVHAFYNQRRANLQQNVKPNDAYGALARLEAEFPGDVLLVTQNIDDLHERAGSRNLLHMHGEMLKARCQNCATVALWTGDLELETPCSGCGAVGGMRPHVVWFGEMPFHMDEICAALDECTLFLSIGTSGNVYPAAGFVAHVRGRDQARAVELNLEPSEGSALFHESILGRAAETVPGFVERLLANGIDQA